jgi:hypothetical protein
MIGVATTGLMNSSGATVDGTRVFLAGFSHETNTFHPVPTSGYSYSTAGNLRLAAWREGGLVAVPGLSANPTGRRDGR